MARSGKTRKREGWEAGQDNIIAPGKTDTAATKTRTRKKKRAAGPGSAGWPVLPTVWVMANFHTWGLLLSGTRAHSFFFFFPFPQDSKSGKRR